MIANLADPSYAVEVSSRVPYVGLVSTIYPSILLVKINHLALSSEQLGNLLFPVIIDSMAAL